MSEALPSMPVEILGTNNSVRLGQTLLMQNEDEAKMFEFRKESKSEIVSVKDKTTLFDKVKNKDELNIIIKSDVQGSNEALKNGNRKNKAY